jgi:2-methylcitrate dehydratase PrpD
MANLASGLAQVWREGSPEGPLQIGFAARNGIAAARASSAGAGAAAYALEGPAGWLRAFADTTLAPGDVEIGAATAWQFDEITVKPYPVCAILQGPVAAFLDLRRAHAVAPDEIAEITLALSPYEAAYPGIDHAGPFSSSIATKMSAQFSLALAAVDGRVTPAGLGRVADDGVLTLSRRVRIAADPSIEPRLSRLVLRLADGRVLSRTVDAPIGRPSFAEAVHFARSLAPEIGTDEASIDRLVDAVAELEHAPTLTRLINCAVACGGRTAAS